MIRVDLNEAEGIAVIRPAIIHAGGSHFLISVNLAGRTMA